MFIASSVYFPCVNERAAHVKIDRVSRPNIKVFVYKKQVNLIHTILKYGDYYDFMDR